jgi:hypothetical protein
MIQRIITITEDNYNFFLTVEADGYVLIDGCSDQMHGFIMRGDPTLMCDVPTLMGDIPTPMGDVPTPVDPPKPGRTQEERSPVTPTMSGSMCNCATGHTPGLTAPHPEI